MTSFIFILVAFIFQILLCYYISQTLLDIEFVMQVAGVTLPYESHSELYERMRAVCPSLVRPQRVERSTLLPTLVAAVTTAAPALTSQELNGEPFRVSMRTLKDYYVTDVISRASQTMARCVSAASHQTDADKYAQGVLPTPPLPHEAPTLGGFKTWLRV